MMVKHDYKAVDGLLFFFYAVQYSVDTLFIDLGWQCYHSSELVETLLHTFPNPGWRFFANICPAYILPLHLIYSGSILVS